MRPQSKSILDQSSTESGSGKSVSTSVRIKVGHALGTIQSKLGYPMPCEIDLALANTPGATYSRGYVTGVADGLGLPIVDLLREVRLPDGMPAVQRALTRESDHAMECQILGARAAYRFVRGPEGTLKRSETPEQYLARMDQIATEAEAGKPPAAAGSTVQQEVLDAGISDEDDEREFWRGWGFVARQWAETAGKATARRAEECATYNAAEQHALDCIAEQLADPARLKDARLRSGLTTYALARLCGLHKSSIYGAEQGFVVLGPAERRRLAIVLEEVSRVVRRFLM